MDETYSWKSFSQPTVSFSEDDCTISFDGITAVHTTVDLPPLNSHVHYLRLRSKLICAGVASNASVYENDRLVHRRARAAAAMVLSIFEQKQINSHVRLGDFLKQKGALVF